VSEADLYGGGADDFVVLYFLRGLGLPVTLKDVRALTVREFAHFLTLARHPEALPWRRGR
jgi:hypothetical protein